MDDNMFDYSTNEKEEENYMDTIKPKQSKKPSNYLESIKNKEETPPTIEMDDFDTSSLDEDTTGAGSINGGGKNEKMKKKKINKTEAGEAGKKAYKWLGNALHYGADIAEETTKGLVKGSVGTVIDILDITGDALANSIDFISAGNTDLSSREGIMDGLDEWFDKGIEKIDIVDSEWANTESGKSILGGISTTAEYVVPGLGAAKGVSLISKLLKTNKVKNTLKTLESEGKLDQKSVSELLNKYSKPIIENAKDGLNSTSKGQITNAINKLAKEGMSEEKAKGMIEAGISATKQGGEKLIDFTKQYPRVIELIKDNKLVTAIGAGVGVGALINGSTDTGVTDEVELDTTNVADTDGDGKADMSIAGGQEAYDSKKDFGDGMLNSEEESPAVITEDDTSNVTRTEEEFVEQFQNYPSIVDYLTKLGVESDASSRSKLAEELGVEGYYVGANNGELNRALYKAIFLQGKTAADLRALLLN